MENEVPNIPKCQICGQDMILKPAGVSRTSGKAYNAFWACPTRHDRQQQAAQPNIPTDQFLTKAQFNEQLDKMRAAFKEVMDTLRENDKDIADLAARMAIVENPQLRKPCEKDEVLEAAKKIFGEN
jgi:hypothetical protein